MNTSPTTIYLSVITEILELAECGVFYDAEDVLYQLYGATLMARKLGVENYVSIFNETKEKIRSIYDKPYDWFEEDQF